MSGSYFFLFFLSLLCCSAERANIRISTHDMVFIENKRTTFTCEASSPHEISIYWYIEDPQTKRRLQWMTTKKTNGELQKAVGRKASWSVTIGRHFENKNLVCRGTAFGKAVFPFPSIKKTIPVDAINLLTPNLELGAPIQLFCDINAAPGVVKAVYFRNLRAAEPASVHRRLNDNWTRYEFHSTFKAKMEFNGWILQCIASTVKNELMLLSDRGHVLSKEKLITVHHFNFTSSSGPDVPIPEGSAVRLSFNVTANPCPRPEQFFLVRNPSSGMNTEINFNITIRMTSKQNFLIFVDFVPEVSGKYELIFRSSVLTRTSASISIDFLNFNFTSSSGPDAPIPEGSTIRLSFNVTTNRHPRPEQFFLVRNLSSGMSTEIDFNITIRIMGKQKFRIFVEFVPDVSGEYQLNFRSSVLTRTSATFSVDFFRVKIEQVSDWRKRVDPPKDGKLLSFRVCSNRRVEKENIELRELSVKKNQSALHSIRKKNETQLKMEKEDGHGLFHHCYRVITTSLPIANGICQVIVKIENVTFKSQIFALERGPVHQPLMATNTVEIIGGRLVVLIPTVLVIILGFVYYSYCHR